MSNEARIPLEARSELGVVMAALLTVRDALLTPLDFFARPSRETSLLPPLLLALLIQVPVGVCFGAVQALRAHLHPELATSHGGPLVVVIGQFLGFFLYPVIAAIIAGIHFGLLFLVGVRGLAYREVLRAVFYLHPVGLFYVALSPLAIGLEYLAPNGGGLVFLLYCLAAIVYTVIALAKVAKTSPFRVLAAEGLLLSVCCCLPVASFAVFAATRGH